MRALLCFVALFVCLQLSAGAAFSGLTTVPALDDQSFAYTENDHIDSPDYQYDANGNTTTGLQYESATTGLPAASATTADQYDYNNRLIRRTQPDGTTIDLLYNTDGVRISKAVSPFPVPGSPPQAPLLTQYHTDANNHTGYAQVYEELKTTGTSAAYLATVYHFGHDLIAIDQRETALGDWEQHFYSYDGLGSVRALTDSAGQQTDSYTYDAFGIQLAQTGTTENAYRYTGEQFDEDLGQYYLRARYNDPNIGRFWSMDRFSGFNNEPLSLHKYLYVHANPIHGIDPSGYFTISSEVAKIFALNAFASFALSQLSGESLAQSAVEGLVGGIAGVLLGPLSSKIGVKLGIPASPAIYLLTPRLGYLTIISRGVAAGILEFAANIIGQASEIFIGNSGNTINLERALSAAVIAGVIAGGFSFLDVSLPDESLTELIEVVGTFVSIQGPIATDKFSELLSSIRTIGAEVEQRWYGIPRS